MHKVFRDILRTGVAVALGAPSAFAQLARTPIDTTAPLGTRANPVQASGPSGEREFLQRLRCADSSIPIVLMRGSFGGGDGHILDGYTLQCGKTEMPNQLVMDMYHGPQRETRAVAPYTVLAQHPAQLAQGCPPAVVADKDSSARYVFIWYEVETYAKVLTQLNTTIAGSKYGTLNVSYVVDTLGIPEPASIKHAGVEDSTIVSEALRTLSSLRYSPAEHHAGCKVRQFGGMTFTVAPQKPK